MPVPHFIIKNQFQKRSKLYNIFYQDILTRDILLDVCQRITGETDFTVEFDNTDYNKGRLAILEYEGKKNFISFSEADVTSRNSSFQSFPSAWVKYHQETNADKDIYFYFLPSTGNIRTQYFKFMYRLMKTAGTIFLNESEALGISLTPFNSAEDIIAQRDSNREKNKGNRSTYATIDEDSTVQIYGKLFGANKYETALLCIAIYVVTTNRIELYEIQEGGLTKLPALARQVITGLGITVITSDLIFERKQFDENDSLRSPRYNYNLLKRLGAKKCALCECEIPQLIQGAHVWPVASIKKANNINQEQKLKVAIDGNNGIWLCNNHHKLFDINLMFIDEQGQIKFKSDMRPGDYDYIFDLTTNFELSNDVLTADFIEYLQKRNSLLNEGLYVRADWE